MRNGFQMNIFFGSNFKVPEKSPGLNSQGFHKNGEMVQISAVGDSFIKAMRKK